jgi:DnaJ-class molecular chaperone
VDYEGSYFVFKIKAAGNDYYQNKIKFKFPDQYISDKIAKTSDLYVKIRVSDHEYFKREGMNIVTENYISVSNYILGGRVKIGTIFGEKEIEISPYKDKVLIKNFGVAKKGDHIAKLNIKLPKRLSDEQFKIYSELRKYDI